MNSVSIDLVYRPIRIGWCIEPGDLEALRGAMRLSFTMWGGRYNPMIPVTTTAAATNIARAFKVDALWAVGGGANVKRFTEQPHLPWPFTGQGIFSPRGAGRLEPTIADLRHPISQLYEQHHKGHPEVVPIVDLYQWQADDPLADIFLATLGACPEDPSYPDYRTMAEHSFVARRLLLPIDLPAPVPIPGRMTLSGLANLYVEPDHLLGPMLSGAGFYAGAVDSFDDLVMFWNLRAAGKDLHFHDPRHIGRLGHALRAEWDSLARIAPVAHQLGWGPPQPQLWHRGPADDLDLTIFQDKPVLGRIEPDHWAHRTAPYMVFSKGRALAALDDRRGRTTMSFAIGDAPFALTDSNYGQHYKLAINPGIGLFGNSDETLHLPDIPALNPVYGRACFAHPYHARADPAGIGLIARVTTDHQLMIAMDVPTLLTAIFAAAGIDAELSKPGLVARSLIRQMGGIDRCDLFKIAGVRDLIERHRPDQSFSRSDAMLAIRGVGTVRPLSDYEGLPVVRRRSGGRLTNGMVLDELLERGVFRPGLDFSCPRCQLDFWRPLDDARTQAICDYCGHAFIVSAQLRDKGWAFRRSGLFGRSDHQEGSIPVALTIQQLLRVLDPDGGHFATAMTLDGAAGQFASCEVDFVVLANARNDGRVQMAIGECKTRGDISAEDVAHLDAVARALTPFADVYIVLAKLAAFSEEEINRARPLNTDHRDRVILLTDRELEPMFPYQRAETEFDINPTVINFADMAQVTRHIFFEARRRTDPIG